MSWSCCVLAGAAELRSPPQAAVLRQWERSLLLGLSRYLPCLEKSREYIGLQKAFCCLSCHFSLVWQNTLCWEADGVGDNKVIQLPTRGQLMPSEQPSALCWALAIRTYERWSFCLVVQDSAHGVSSGVVV